MAKKSPLKSSRRIVRYIFRTWRYGKDGQKLYAKDYGYRAWKIPVYAD